MAVHVEPRPATLPLPGGQEGASVRLHPLLAGEMLAPAGLLVGKPGHLAALRTLRDQDKSWIPIPAFLVEHPGAGPVLIDTGLNSSVAVDPAQSLGRAVARVAPVRMEPEQAVARQVERLGVAPADLRTVVMTHLHYDHASGMSEFPAATFYFSSAEWEGATAPRPTLRGYRPQQYDHAFDYRALDFDGPAVSSYQSFGRSIDLFGDGSVRLCFTPGHTRGHQSVLLRLAGREVLLTGDAAYLLRTIRESAMPLLTDDEHRFGVSLREIQIYCERNPDAAVITGHDAEAWPRLESVYQ